MGNENYSKKSVKSIEDSIESLVNCQKEKQKECERNYETKVSFVFWNKENQENIIIGAIDEKKDFHKFMYDKQENGRYSQARQQIFLENLIAIQDGRKVEKEKKTNHLLTIFQSKETPEEFLYELFQEEINFEKNTSYQVLNIKTQNKTSSKNNYAHCYQNFLEQNQLIFEEIENKKYVSYDWNNKKIKATTDKVIYKNAIILKTSLKNEDQIFKCCQKWKSGQEFLEKEKL
ncbi:unnamed protein product [Paramecium sonneborni]|uniref:Uncharacterized protein n=1 Tax=Paramecium sonneborni TaxID=65129 RepID=A0A8S1QID0_9CILI|nr:unnamed protein product [Paramecium sonneborni]